MDRQAIIDATRHWISAVVIGLDLCPFAGRVFHAGAIRYAVTDARDEQSLRDELATELKALAENAVPGVETTLLIHPHVLKDFLEYNDFLDVADDVIRRLDLEGVIQVASFHPDYQFAGTEPDAVENYTNRSPYPMLHLLREESITAFAGDPAELDAIPERNIETLRRLGKEKILELLRTSRGSP